MLNLKRRLLKPWFVHQPSLIARVLLSDLGLKSHGWQWVETCFGTQILCDTRKTMGRAIYRNGVYELATTELVWRLLKGQKGATFMDVGANIGYYSLLALKRLGPDGCIVAFEPHPEIYEILSKNLSGTGARTYQSAVSESTGFATLHIPSGSEANEGLSTLEKCKETVGGVRVETVSLAKLITEEIFLLKVDVEGHESSVFAGAKPLFEQNKVRHIIFEEHNVLNSGIPEVLTDYGFNIFSIGWNYEGLLIRPLGETSEHYLNEAPNFIATQDCSFVESATASRSWTVLRCKDN
jgi:FkbM family methyltransferase